MNRQLNQAEYLEDDLILRPTAPMSAHERMDMTIIMERIHLYNAGGPCGTVAIRRALYEQEDISPVPSVSRISAVLRDYGLTYGHLGWDDDIESQNPYVFTKKPKGGVAA